MSSWRLCKSNSNFEHYVTFVLFAANLGAVKHAKPGTQSDELPRARGYAASATRLTTATTTLTTASRHSFTDNLLYHPSYASALPRKHHNQESFQTLSCVGDISYGAVSLSFIAHLIDEPLHIPKSTQPPAAILSFICLTNFGLAFLLFIVAPNLL